MNRLVTTLASASLALGLAACQTGDSIGPAAAVPAPPSRPGLAARQGVVATDRTPLQQALKERIARRTAQGLPVPAVAMEFGPVQPGPMLLGPVQAGQSVIVAKTVLEFASPAQAGHARWPDLVVRNNSATPGVVREGDYTELVRERLADQLPGVWSQYTFGFEPRRYTIIETLTVTEPGLSTLAAPDMASVTSSAGAFLMGFSVPGPNLDYTIDFDVEGCLGELCVTVVDFTAGFRLDWGLGMRLPMNLSFSSTEPLLEGSISSPTSLLNGLNWSPTNYADAGVLVEDGNEYVTRFIFLLGVFLEVASVDVIDLGPRVEINRTRDFTTPFGPGATFALPEIDLPIWGVDVSVASASIGFRVTPHAGSDRFTAAWAATGEASGSGNLTYTSPAIPQSPGPLTAIDGPGVANVRVDDMRYFFTQFLLDLGLFFHLDVFGIVDETFTVPITDFNLSALTGGLSIGTHDGTPNAFQASVAIVNVAPTAVIDRTGTIVINGVQTFLGQPAAFTGTARDPGRDDLLVSWSWGDGDPAPDVSTSYPVPHQVSETRSHDFSGTCMYNVSLQAVDDDAAVGQDQVPVLFVAGGTGGGRAARLEGYWQHQFGRNGATDFDEPTLACYLQIVAFASQVFGEHRSIASIAAAFDVLHLAQYRGSAREQLDRELLVTWLNFANGAFAYDELIDTNRDGVADTPYADAMANIEGVRRLDDSTPAELRAATRLLHQMNASRAGVAE